MAMAYPYCNTTSDLQSVVKDIEKFSGKDTLESFTAESGQNYTYRKNGTGYVGAVYEDSVALDEQDSVANVDANAGSFWYDSTNDILYINCTDSNNPDQHTIQVAVDDWASFKTTMANRAFQQLESLLDPKYPRPLPFAQIQYNSLNYDGDIVECAAILTCINIIKHRDADNPLIETLQNRVWNAQEEIGILWEYRQGERSFSFEVTADQFNGNVEVITRDSSSSGMIYVAGQSDRSGSYRIRVKITTAGAVGTAKWKYSSDNSVTWSSEIETTNNYIPFYAGLYLKFIGTFYLNDEFEVVILGDPETVTSQKIRSIKLRRN